MPEDPAISELATTLVGELNSKNRAVAAAESCTGGWIAKALTDVPGSSGCFGYGIVSYSNGAKESILGVNNRTLAEHGAVSEPVVREMAEGTLRLSGADISVAVSGVAGPDGGSDEKPVGTVWFAWSMRGPRGITTETDLQRFEGNRESIRMQTVIHGLKGVRGRLPA
ncbi:MAG TPA: nicotinamide-nucleotide amidohydrolase family protein [Woeseiaceae bacterium]|nr:nicotinamide-nucleotide amidohydrolase family protein [Woeseiaceae bacterium]